MLETPLIIRNTKLNSRIVMPPMASGKSTDEGFVTEDIISYYRDRADGTGLIITEHAYIADIGKASANQLSISKDEDIEGLKRLAEVIHEQSDAKLIAQLNHAGGYARKDDPEGVAKINNVAPSAVLRPGKEGRIPKMMDEEDIETVIRQFADAAERAIEAGFDGVEIHSAHGYLLDQFYSPLTNLRTDEYGGSLENRLRIHGQILKAVRERIGNEPLISIRLGGCDYMEGGSTVEDAVQAAMILEKDGADMISVSGGMNGYIRPGHNEPGYFKEMTLPMKKAVNIPVLLSGGVIEPEDAEALLQEKAADLIGVGRAMLKDADWSRKALNTKR